MSSVDNNSSSPVKIQISLTDLEKAEAEQLISHLHRYLAQSKPDQNSSNSIVKLPHPTASSTDIAIDTPHASKLGSQTPEKLNSKPSLPHGWYKYIDKILFLIAFGYLSAVAVWLTQSHSKPFFQTSTPQPIAALTNEEIVNEADQSSQPTPSLQDESYSDGAKTNPLKNQSVVPVYLPHQSNISTVAPLKSNSVGTNIIALEPSVQPIFIPTPSKLEVNQPQTSTTAALQPPVIPVASPIPTPPPPTPTPTPSQPVAKVDSTNTSSNSHQTDEMSTGAETTSVKTDKTEPPTGTLIGMLALGENSAALFSVNGISHRAAIGEKIGNTDWILQAVESNSVKISSPQHSRIIGVGEQF